MSIARSSSRSVRLATGLALLIGVLSLGDAALAQEPSAPGAGTSAPAASGLSSGGPTVAPTSTPAPTRVPQPVVILPAMPADDDLARAASLSLVDTPTRTRGDVDLAAVGAAAAAQQGSMTTADWSLRALVDSFEGDPAKAFAFVRDSIGFDPYPGVLRGAAGTLAARSGNAYDRALLLKWLLDQMALQSRFAFATLDDQAAERVAEQVLRAPSAPLEDGRAAALGPIDVHAVGSRAQRDYALLRQALGARTGGMHGAVPADLVADTRDHAWIQVAWGTGWLDYDPTLADSAPGQVLAAATSTAPTIPDDVWQGIRIQVIAGSLWGSSVEDAVVLDRTLDAAVIADSQVFLYFQPQLEGLGGSIVDALSGVQQWTPVLMVDGEPTAGTSFAAGGRGTDIFGDAVDAPPLTTLRVVVTRTAPGRPDESGTHVLVNRLPDRLVGSGAISTADLAPLPGDQTGPLAMGVVEQVLVSTGGANPWLQAVRRGISADFLDQLLVDLSTADEHPLGDLLYPLAVANASLVLASEQLAVPAANDPNRIRTYVDAPRVFLVGIGQSPTTAQEFAFSTDLLLDGVRVVASDAAATPDAARRSIWYGALESALETELSLRRAAGVSGEDAAMSGASFAMTQPLQVMEAADAGPVVPAALRAALDAGAIAVVPRAPATSHTWWTVDPATGATRAVLDPGFGGVNGGIAWGKIINRPPVINRGGAGGANTWYLNDDGSITRAPRPPGGGAPGGGTPTGPPPSRCGGGSEYVTLLGCVSIPMAWVIRIGLSLVLIGVITDVIIYFVT
jgi:hypothetical protein